MIPEGEIHRLGPSFNKRLKKGKRVSNSRDLNQEITIAKPTQLSVCPRCGRMSVLFDPTLDGGAGRLKCIWEGMGCERLKAQDGSDAIWKRRIPQEMWRDRYRKMRRGKK